MPLVASTIPNLVSGVSQQPAPSRLRTSGEEMINALPTVVSGLIKRPPTEWVAGSIPAVGSPDDNVAVHMIDRASDEKYILLCGNGDLALFSDTGVQQTVTFPDGKAYLPTTDMWRKLRFVTVADTTFILNTSVSVLATSPVDTRVNPRTKASVFIKQAVASVSYAVYVNSVLVASFSTSSNTSEATALEGTSEIAEGLRANAVTRGIVSNPGRIGTTFYFDLASEADVISVDDNFGGRGMTVFKDKIQSFDDLPPQEVEGRLVKVAGDLDDTGDASYWVEFTDGVWTETVGFDAQRSLDNATMPHVLVKTGPGTFEFRRNTWADRVVGDDDSNPDPSFIGGSINGMFLFKGRLGFLAEENVVLSEVSELESFYRTTVVQLLASDPIDVASTTGRVSTLYHAASFSDELVLFSDKQQFRLSSGNVLSPETVGITSSTAFPCSTLVSPVAAGSSVFFVSNGATNSIAREIKIESEGEIIRGDDITVQVPTYIPLDLRQLSVSVTSEVLVGFSNREPRNLYVYKWYEDSRQQKIQSAWCKWTFGDVGSIVGTGFLDDFLYIVSRDGSFYRIERMLVSSEVEKTLLLDSQTIPSQFASFFYDSGTDETEIRMVSGYDATFQWYNLDDGSEYPATKITNTRYRIPGNVTAENLIGGLNYEFRYEFSQQYLREDTPDGEGAIQDGRLQMRYWSQIYTDTSYFEAHVTDVNGVTRATVFNGRTLADPDNVTDVIPRDTGEFKFPVFGQNEDVKVELVSNQPFRCAFGSVEWTAVYKPKARRLR